MNNKAAMESHYIIFTMWESYLVLELELISLFSGTLPQIEAILFTADVCRGQGTVTA